MQHMKNNWIKIVLWIIVFQLIGMAIGVITQSNIHSWYLGLEKSSLTPPSIVFAIVWPILYVLLAISGYILWSHRQNSKMRPILYLFTLQMLLNWAWSPVFFNFHWIFFSFFLILNITFLTILIMLFTKRKIRIIKFLLMPYLLWLIFASYLNGYILWYN